MNKIKFLLIVAFLFQAMAVTVDSGLTDEQVKSFFNKFSEAQKNEILEDCKKELGPAAANKTGDALVDLCIEKARSNIDPLDNYIDPDTLIDYGKEFDNFSEGKKKHVLNRCTMFVIQNEMGQSGERGMSNAEIETYERRVLERCEAILNKHVYGKNCTADNIEECEKNKTLDGKLYEIDRTKGDLLTFTLDQCVSRMQVTKAHCEAAGGLLGGSCQLDFRRQCYDFITKESDYFEDPNRELYTCADFEDQTKTIALECRSYCYQKKICEITDENFINRVIGNVYLRKKKGQSSCVKDKSFGSAGDNKIWVHQSCHGEFGIQYKDPSCGYRPTCDVTPFEDESIPVSGVEDTFLTCDGNGSPNPNDVDPTQNTESTGTVWCKAHLYKKDKNGKLTDEIDESREISRIYNIELLEKLGPNRCNPGGNGSPIDYLSKDKGSFDGGWGVEVINYCHARFKLKVAWKQKMCTMAGEKSEQGNTCCNGLIHDPDTKICNVPEYIAPALPETEKIPEIITDENDGRRCSQQLDEGIVSYADSVFKELAVYENMFTILDGQADPIKQISLENREANENIPQNRKLNNEAIKIIHDSAVSFRTEYAKIKIDHEKITKKIVCDLNEFLLIKSIDLGVTRVKELDIDGDQCPEVKVKVDETYAYFKKVEEGSTDAVKPNLAEDNLLKDVPDIQEGSQVAQEFMIDANIAYVKAILGAFDIYVTELERASLTGQNLVWYCAHKENCSEFNWLIKHKQADSFNTREIANRLKYRVITDFLHNPIYPTQLISSRARILPELEPGFKKYLYSNKEFLKTESEIAELKEYAPVIDYLKGEVTEVQQPEWYKNIFHLYGQEFPLRENSTLAKNEFFSEFSSSMQSGTTFKRGEIKDNKSEVIPYICDKQSITNYQVRVPLGKALIPMRMVQITEFLHKFIEAQGKIFLAQRTCTAGYERSDVTVTPNTQSGQTASNMASEGNVTQGSNSTKNLASAITSLGGIGQSKMFGTGNLIASNILSMYGVSKKPKLNSAATSNLDKTVFDSQAQFALDRNARKIKTDKLVDNSKKKRKDKLIGNYVDSLDKTYGKSFDKGNSKNFFSKLSDSFLRLGSSALGNSKKGSGGSKANMGGSSDALDLGGNGTNQAISGGAGLRNQTLGRGGGSGSGSGSYGSGYGGTGSGVATNQVTGLTRGETQRVLDGLKREDLDVEEGDTLFDIISKRYKQTAYPKFLKTE
ncbi:hypothetical protein [Bacteriovorax sp. Seq25_V]|uniref:hypothetical protein n=1 Tax=Bacteriovorax sp. Seq25_V TaxID=1201288 RepID=UPI000389E296|nr:hypothetical protein [Bacteriovorax sp. Seq25_V]EQC44676.1 hypothetical protein M900_0459 [Bacteriovorax sp. Seq25_V]